MADLLAARGPLPGEDAAAALGWTLERWWAAVGAANEFFDVTGKGYVLTAAGRRAFGVGPREPAPTATRLAPLTDDTAPAAIVLAQQRDVAAALVGLGGLATVEVLSAEVLLPEFSVGQRLRERPEWFRAAGDGWGLTAAGRAAAERAEDSDD